MLDCPASGEELHAESSGAMHKTVSDASLVFLESVQYRLSSQVTSISNESIASICVDNKIPYSIFPHSFDIFKLFGFETNGRGINESSCENFVIGGTYKGTSSATGKGGC